MSRRSRRIRRRTQRRALAPAWVPALTLALAVQLASSAAHARASDGAEGPAPGATLGSTGGTGAAVETSATDIDRTKTGTGMLVSGGIFTGLGVLGRVGLEVYWGAFAGLNAGDPFQRYSTKNIILVTNMNNAMVVPGLGLLTAGLYRRGVHQGAGATPIEQLRSRRRKGVIILTVGAALWGATRGVFLGVANSCSTNACVYAYLETTYWASAALIHTGAGMVADSSGRLRAAGHRAAPRRGPVWSLTPLVGRDTQGLGIAGAF